jgi:hypothetical protein
MPEQQTTCFFTPSGGIFFAVVLAVANLVPLAYIPARKVPLTHPAFSALFAVFSLVVVAFFLITSRPYHRGARAPALAARLVGGFIMGFLQMSLIVAVGGKEIWSAANIPASAALASTGAALIFVPVYLHTGLKVKTYVMHNLYNTHARTIMLFGSGSGLVGLAVGAAVHRLQPPSLAPALRRIAGLPAGNDAYDSLSYPLLPLLAMAAGRSLGLIAAIPRIIIRTRAAMQKARIIQQQRKLDAAAKILGVEAVPGERYNAAAAPAPSTHQSGRPARVRTRGRHGSSRPKSD